ncbi:MAG: tRNA pseudouridine(38-40) synthase TruA, partial [Oscillospiraceae bacterium]
VEQKGEMISFVVKADGYLYNMVRIMVGTLIKVGRGQLLPEDIDRIILSKNRDMAGVTVPPQGLFLTGVTY